MPKWFCELPRKVMEAKAKEHGIDPLLIAAIIHHESGCKTWAIRFEPETYARFKRGGKPVIDAPAYASQLRISIATEEVSQCTSWGLMQVMGWVARGDHAYKDHLTKLCDPETNIDIGARHLKYISQRYDTEAEIISAYNWGHVSRVNGLFKNQKNYVDPICATLRELRRM